jgi:hypothetical protein
MAVCTCIRNALPISLLREGIEKLDFKVIARPE